MRTRLKDVAKRVNLSPALVSGVLNNRDNVWASEETRARVLEAARDLNYHPSTAAKALSAGRTNTVSLVYRRLQGTNYRLAYTGLVDAFSEEMQKRGFNLMVSNFATEREVFDHLRRLANANGSEAVILWGREADTEPQGELLESLGVPFIVKGRHEARHPDWYQVDFDHEWMMEQALDRVASLGHRRIAFLGFPLEDAFVRALRRGFESAHLRRFGTPAQFFAACPDDLKSNALQIDAWLSLPLDERPTGFIVGAGNYAWHALEASLARRGWTLSNEPGGGFSAAGIASYYFTLTFGEAMAYQGMQIDNLALHAAPRLLDAILCGETGERIVRYRPELTKAPSMGLPIVPLPNIAVRALIS